MEKKEQKKWSRPQLVILGRGTPEESVLAGCKTYSSAPANGSAGNAGCHSGSGQKCDMDANS